jgi:hypothetical protein
VPPLLSLVAYRWLGPAGALAAIALAGLSPTLVVYANEAKPYGNDAFVTVAVLAATLAVRDRRERPSAGARSSCAGSWASSFRSPAAFVLPAALASLALDPVVRGERRRGLAACAAAWAATLAALYSNLRRGRAQSPSAGGIRRRPFLFPGAGFEGRACSPCGDDLALVRRDRLAHPGPCRMGAGGGGAWCSRPG